MYHLHLQAISRSDGRSATAAAAYRSAEMVHDDLRKQAFDYTRKSGVVHAELIGTEMTREQLWNSAEFKENRKNSIVAREMTISLPHELNPAARIGAAREFARWLNDEYQVAVDLAIHEPHKQGDQRNHHAHLLFTARPLVGDEWAGKKDRRWNAREGHDTTNRLREQWASIVQPLVDDPGNWDHRSYEERGIEKNPSNHIGVVAMSMHRKGINSERFDRIKEEKEKLEVIENELWKIAFEIEDEHILERAEKLDQPTNQTYENRIRTQQRRSGIDRRTGEQYQKLAGPEKNIGGRSDQIENEDQIFRGRGDKISDEIPAEGSQSRRIQGRAGKSTRPKSAFAESQHSPFANRWRRSDGLDRSKVFTRLDDPQFQRRRWDIDEDRRRKNEPDLHMEKLRKRDQSIRLELGGMSF